MEEQKAKELIGKYGAVIANHVVDEIITELQTDWNQDRIDFYLDVKNIINE
jgi:hypothetical protein